MPGERLYEGMEQRMHVLLPARGGNEARSCSNKRREALNKQRLSRQAQQRSVRILSRLLPKQKTQTAAESAQEHQPLPIYIIKRETEKLVVQGMRLLLSPSRQQRDRSLQRESSSQPAAARSQGSALAEQPEETDRNAKKLLM